MPENLLEAVSVERFLEGRDPVGLLRDMVGFDTRSDESPLIDYLANRWSTLGIPYAISPARDGRRNITATVGEREPSLLFNSHMDTVPPGDRALWHEDAGPFDGTVRDGRLYGRGSVDAKGCLASMISAFEALYLAGAAAHGRLTLSAVCWEESGGWGTRAEVERGVRAQAAIVGEPTNLRPKLGHRGSARYEVKAIGRAAHSAMPEQGKNAIADIAAVVAELERMERRLATRIDPVLRQHPNLTTTIIEGGVAGNVVPASCGIVVDRRFLPSESIDDVDAEISAVIETVAQGRQATIRVQRARAVEGCAIPPSEPIWILMSEVVKDLSGIESAPDGFFACCDMVFLWNWARIPTLVYGPGAEDMCHTANENLAIDDLWTATRVYAELGRRWLRGSP